MRPVISIDFGNSYTKVALRPDAGRPAELLRDQSLKLDEFSTCVPTVAACYDRGPKPEWHYGADVMRFRENTAGLTVYRNWKPRFFEGPGTRPRPAARLQPVPAMAAAAGSLPAPPGIEPAAWETMASTLPADTLRDLWARLGGRGPAQAATEETDLEHKHMGLGFFKWLRGFFDPTCRRLVGRSVADVPARVSLPSFGSVAKAEELLKEILSEAGWQLADRAMTLPEPLSNAIGAFTEGKNLTHRGGASPHYGQMFADTGLLHRIREATLHDGPQTAWVLIVDVGGYTADFAMVALDLTDIDSRLEGTVDGKSRLKHHSEALGVTELDRRVMDGLSEAKHTALVGVIADPDQQRLEAFHQRAYGFLGQHSLGRNLVIGGTPAEKELIRQVVRQFAEQVADDAESFLSVHQYEQVDDLILTGGGTKIPGVRDALCTRLSHYGVRKAHLYLPGHEKPPPGVSTHPLKAALVRGATAMGGASVYFDFADA